MKKAKTKIAAFKTEAEERAFWEKQDSTTLLIGTRLRLRLCQI